MISDPAEGTPHSVSQWGRVRGDVGGGGGVGGGRVTRGILTQRLDLACDTDGEGNSSSYKKSVQPPISLQF